MATAGRRLARSASAATAATGPPPPACSASGGARRLIHPGQELRVRLARIECAQWRLHPCGAAAPAHDERTAVLARLGRHDPDVGAAGHPATVHQPLTGGGIGRGAVVVATSMPMPIASPATMAITR